MKKRILSLLLALLTLLGAFPLTPFSAVAEEEIAQEVTAPEEPIGETEGYIEGMVSLTCEGSDTVTLKKGDKIYAFTELSPELGEGGNYCWQMITEGGIWANISGYVFPYAVITESLLVNAARADGSARMRCIVSANGEKHISNELVILFPTGQTETQDTSEEAEVSIEAEQAEVAQPLSLRAAWTVSDAVTSPLLLAETVAETEVETVAETEAEIEEEIPQPFSSTADAFHIVITYTYRHATQAPGLNMDGQPGANTFTVTLPKGGYYTGTIATPPEIGYLPYVKVEQEAFVTGYRELTAEQIESGEKAFPDSYYVTYDGEQYVLANSVEFKNQISNVEVHVYFIPQEVTFRVKIYEQNLYDDEYSLAETITYTGTANAAVGEGHDTLRVGFTALYYDPKLPISEDGSFAVDIYYDRNYYLIQFDLNDGGEAFGAPNHYVRYNTPVLLAAPTRPGYSFVNWTLTAVTDDDKQPVASHFYTQTATGGQMISSTEHNLNYSANWKTETTSYTVIYWLENTEDDGFTLECFRTVENVTPSATVNATDDLEDFAKELGLSDATHFTFSEVLSDKNVKVQADGTTAVNAYYLRNYYTLTFNGGARCIIPEHTHDASCPTGTCTLQTHIHSKDCGLSELVCDKEEHTHVDACCSIRNPEGQENHVHSDACCTVPYHVHDVVNFSDCIKAEHPIHHASCYSLNNIPTSDSLSGDPKTAYNRLVSRITSPLDGYVYRIRTSLFGTIYNFLYVHEQWFYLGTGNTYNGVTASGIKDPSYSSNSTSSEQASTICGLEVHTHGDGNCICSQEEHDHTTGCNCPLHVHGVGECEYNACGKEQHRHTIACYEFKCGLEAHTHGGDCVRKCQEIEHTHGTCDDNTSTKTFYQVRRKYDSDISDVWATIDSVFTDGQRWKANTYFKEVLVYLPFMPPTDITFSVNEGSVDKIYNIHYYLEALGETEIPYKKAGEAENRYFDLYHSVYANYNYLTEEEDFFNIRGFTQYASNPAFSGGQIETNSGGDVKLYYSRNEYSLEFNSLGTHLSPFDKTLKYAQPIDASFELLAKDIPYPSNEEPGAIQFVGWYTTPNCADGTEFTFDGGTAMPLGGLVLYAKWETCSYTVNIYSDVQKTELVTEPQTVLFGTLLDEPSYGDHQNPDNSDGETAPETTEPSETTEVITPELPLPPSYDEEKKLIFAGWYYIDGTTEKRFDFNTMPIKSDMEIYAKWTSRIPVNYEIRYVFHNGTDYVDIAEATTGASLAGVTKTFLAKVGADLSDNYQVGYFPEVRAHSMTMSTEAAENVYRFVYSIPQSITYKVTHVFTDNGEEKVFESIFGTGNNALTEVFTHTIEGEMLKTSAASVVVSFREGITKDAIARAAEKQYKITLTENQKTQLWNVITSLSPDYYLQDLVLSTKNDENNAVFKWEKNSSGALYQVIYYIESIDGMEYTVESTHTHVAEVGTKVTAEVRDIPYFELYEEHPDSIPSGTVVAMSTDPTTGGLNKGLVMRLYYKRQLYNYTVYHYKEGTQTSLADKVVKQARYEETITVADEAVQIDGYTLVNGSATVKISATNDQTVECFYQGLEVYYQYQVLGVGGTIGNPTDTVAIGGDPPEGKTLTLWGDRYFLHAWYYSVGDGERIPLEEEWLSEDKMTVTLPAPDVSMAGQTVYVFAEVFSNTRRFKVEGFTSPENDPQAFIFHLKGKKGTVTEKVDVTFIIFDNGHTDITLLPYGEYTLTTLHWAWRYGHPDTVTFDDEVLDATSGTVSLSLDTPGDVAIVYPTQGNEKWLTDAASGILSVHPVEKQTP